MSFVVALFWIVFCHAENVDKQTTVLTTITVCLPSEEVAQKYLAMKIGLELDYHVYIVRPDCVSNLVTYDDILNGDHNNGNIDLIEFESVLEYFEIRDAITSNKIDKFFSLHKNNCEAILSNSTMMDYLHSIPFDIAIIQTWDVCGTIISDILGYA